MRLSDKRTDRVARAICYAAKVGDCCPVCDIDNRGLGPVACIMSEQFRVEAEAAIRAMKGY